MRGWGQYSFNLILPDNSHSRNSGNPVDNNTPYKEGLLTGFPPAPVKTGVTREWELSGKIRLKEY